MRPVKITYLIGSLATGGAEGQLLELLRKLDRSRWDPSLVLFDSKTSHRAADLVGDIASLGIASGGHSRLRIRGLKTGKAVLMLTRYLNRRRPQILHAFLPAACILAAAATRIVTLPVLIGGRRSLVDCYRTGGMVATVDRLAIRICDFAVGNSRAVTQELIQLDGVPTERTATIYNGVDTQRFQPGNRLSRNAYGWTDDNIVFGMVANFFGYKRHLDFVRVAALIAAEVPQARFLIAGEDRGTLQAVRREIGTLGLESRFVIIPGTPEPEKLYPAMDVYICTSETEGLSNVLLEAGASGAPIIATRVGGNTEIVTEGENGFLVPVGDCERMVSHAITLARNSELRKSLGKRGRQLILQSFSLDVMVRNHEQLYCKLLNERRPAGSRIASND